VTTSLPPRRSGQIERPDCRLHYEVTGQGPAIIFMHGLGGNHLSWWQQVAHFSQAFSCVAYSTRGFAPSSTLAGGPDPKDYAGDLAAVIETLGLQHVVLVGQSMGGWPAVE
jgi:3-oxoadipate enol-lactonase